MLSDLMLLQSDVDISDWIKTFFSTLTSKMQADDDH